MSDLFDIDLTGIEASNDGGGWSAFPSGEYRVMITKAEVKDTKAGTGKRLALELTVLSNDELNGRAHWEGLNIVNPNEVAQRIAHEHLAMLADAAGLGRDFLKTAGTGGSGRDHKGQSERFAARIRRQGWIRELGSRLQRNKWKGADDATHVHACCIG